MNAVNEHKKFGMAIEKWRVLMLAAFAVLAAGGFLCSVLSGAVAIPVSALGDILNGGGDNASRQILLNIRLPRAIVAALVGMNLAVSGAVLQAVMKNPLADPHIIGISSGAGLTGIAILILFPAYTYLMPAAAFTGAMVAAIMIYILAWKNGIKPVRIILAGVAVSAFLGAAISSLLIFYSDRVHGALLWMVGGLAARSWHDVTLIVPYTLAGLTLSLAGAYYLNLLQLGDDMARGLGLSVERARLGLTAIASLLAASAVSVAGLLGFVGLIVPHMVRLLGGTDYRYIIPGSALLGMAVVTWCDTVSRVILAPVELPVGIIMAFLGAPFFLYLLRREL